MKKVDISKGNPIIRLDNDIVNKNMLDYDNNLSVYQKKLVFKLLISFKNGEDLNGTHWSEISSDVELLGDYSIIEKKNFVQGLALAMFDYYEDDENFARMPLFSSVGLKYNKLTYTFNSELMRDLLSTPDIEYFLLNYSEIKHFKFKYSIPLYILINKDLSANSKVQKTFLYNVSSLRDYLGIGDLKYARYDSFLDKVIKPAINEINAYTNISIVGDKSFRTGTIKKCWKVPYKNEIGIGGISRKFTTQEYMDDKESKRAMRRKNK